ncbi:GTPase-associated protein 1-related protein [Pseudonocardia sp. TRM90224]|uniref:GTPase-associated protein 1-related protein n=1 Tax=Pseudonocardia sp. TRM90224 TaxID=2812678 RepID=UPI001E4B72D6|nr:GTPase-associated protein 1-related protein [Pseudonocardia sp. TRM90224]
MGDFGSLHYTGCRAGEGLLGIAGLQFRAVSDGVTPQHMTLVERNCLYEPAEEWMRQRIPAGDHPPSFAHTASGGLATATGVYLGAEGAGSREGNHHTHAIVTDDLDTYGQVRPAQLWRSEIWVTDPGPAEWTGPTRCRRVPGDPTPGPMNPEYLQAWTAAQPDGHAVLAAVHTALVAACNGGKRVLFVSSDPEPVIAWIAAATLLMPRRDALRVGFKVFAANPEYGSHEAVAVHPDWAGSHRDTTTETAFVVFDLEAGTRSPLVVGAAGEFWAARFLAAGAGEVDSYDVLDAIELSGQLPETPPGQEGIARIVAAAVVLREAVHREWADPVLRWLSSRWREFDDHLLGELVPRLLDAPLSAENLAALDVIAASARRRPVGELITWQVFARSLADATGRRLPAPASVEQATEMVEQVLADADPTTLADVLALAVRHGLRPRSARFPGALQRFAHWWAETGDQQIEVDRWPCAAELLDLTRDALTQRVLASPPSTVDALGTLWWPRLLQTFRDPHNPLDVALATAAIRSGEPEAARWTRDVLRMSLGRSGRPDSVMQAVRILHPDRLPAVADLPELLTMTTPEAGIDAATAQLVERLLAEHARLDRPAVLVLDRLTELGRSPQSDKVRGWQRQIERMREIVTQVAGWPGELDALEAAVVIGVAAQIRKQDVPVVESAVPELVEALRAPHPSAAAVLVTEMDKTRRRYVQSRLAEVLANAPDDRTIATAFLVAVHQTPPNENLLDAVTARRKAMTVADATAVADLLAPHEQKVWWAMGEKRSRFGKLIRWRPS